MIYAKISQVISNVIAKELNYDEEKKEIIAYSIEYLILQILGFVPIIFLGYIFNVLAAALTAAIFGGVLRKFSGGAHFNSPNICLLFGAIVYTAIGKIAVEINKMPGFNFNFILILLIFSLLIVYRLAPVDSPAKPIHSKDFKRRLKLLSVVVVFISFILILIIDNQIFKISSALGIIYQTTTLLPLFNRRR